MADLSLCITSQCNCKCGFCYAAAFTNGPEQAMSAADVWKICQFAGLQQAPSSRVTLSGGEPTLHPQFIEIVETIRRMNPSAHIRVLTNLLCGEDLLQRVGPLGVGAVVNVGGYGGYTPEQQERLRANLAFLRANRLFRWLWLAVTITEEDEDFGFLYELLRDDTPRSIDALRIAVSVPGQDFANCFPRELSTAYGERYLEIVRNCHRVRPNFTYVNECFTNMCMMSEEIYEKLTPVVANLRSYCSGSMDILPDSSMHWCFAFAGLPEMSIANIFEYRSYDEARAALNAKAGEILRSLGRQCDTSDCTSVSCPGPCPAVMYYRKHVQR